MNLNVAAIEIKNTCFKLLIGYLYDGKINVIYRKDYPLSVSTKDGDIYDLNALTEDLKKIKAINDPKVNLKIEINDIVLILPPFGLEVFESEKTTSTIAVDGKIKKIDITNVLNMVRKSRIENQNNIIADIVPSLFSCDDNQVYKEPPLGVLSSSLLIKARVYTLPQKLVENFKQAVSDAGIGVKRVVISPLGINTLLELNHIPTDRYVLIDYNNDNTIVSLFGSGNLFESKYFSVGSSEITRIIANTFQTSFEKAESLKKLYGLDARENEYNPSILSVYDDLSDIIRKYNKEELSQVVDTSLREWGKLFSNCLDTLLNQYGNLKNDIPFVFIGNGTLLNGFKDYISYQFPNNPSTFFTNNSIGATSPGDANLLGAIAFTSIYKGSLEDESKVEIANVAREEKEYREDEDEL